MVEIRSAIAGAVAGALTTVAVGPFLEFKVGQILSDSDWAGEWQTTTCFKSGRDESWTVTLKQQGNNVTGIYLGMSQSVKGFWGNFAGTVEVERLSGTWTQVSSYGEEGGPFDFTLNDGGQAFSGSYQNELDRTNSVWLGRRDGKIPKCR